MYPVIHVQEFFLVILIYLGIELLSYRECEYSTLEDNAKLFSKLISCSTLGDDAKFFSKAIALLLGIVRDFNFTQLNRCKMIPHHGSDLHFPDH